MTAAKAAGVSYDAAMKSAGDGFTNSENAAWRDYVNQANRIDAAYTFALNELSGNPSFDAAGYITNVADGGNTNSGYGPVACGGGNQNGNNSSTTINSNQCPKCKGIGKITEKRTQTYSFGGSSYMVQTSCPTCTDYNKVLQWLNAHPNAKYGTPKMALYQKNQPTGKSSISDPNAPLILPPGYKSLTYTISVSSIQAIKSISFNTLVGTKPVFSTIDAFNMTGQVPGGGLPISGEWAWTSKSNRVNQTANDLQRITRAKNDRASAMAEGLAKALDITFTAINISRAYFITDFGEFD